MVTYVEIKHLNKRFGDEYVLQDINMNLYQGKVYGFIGNNGSGKTVLMKCISGFLPVTSGHVRVWGYLIGEDIDFPHNFGVLIETPGFLLNQTGYRNLEILANLRGKIGRQEIRNAIQMVGLDPDSQKPVSKYSLGMRQRLGIAQAIMENPDLLILDEPFNGLDRHGVEDIRNLLLELKKQNKTMILSSHNREDIRILCDEVFELDGGKLVAKFKNPSPKTI